ncbi:TetR/AcrR family transcriptional regulator [Sporosarcina obsidiansis]|uniref:TetR/AcrR family transcriptional regulator n=1 Tax=Sporosarcina obsidiansis TaxID=2660748 RepID=UPI00129BB1D1|nr:TetR/AcrR family transcriptional regulator [Sporosarcina obsidiansis]
MSPRTSENFKEIRDIRKQQLKDTAIELFGMKGYAATKISEITGKAELIHGLFYHYFKTKEELYVSVIIELLETIIDTINKAKDESESPLKQLVWLTGVTHSGSLKEGVYRHILILQALYSDLLPQQVKQEIVEKYHLMVDLIAKIIEEGQQVGEFIEGDPEELAIYHLSLVHGLLLTNARKTEPIKLSVDKVLRQLKPYTQQGDS